MSSVKPIPDAEKVGGIIVLNNKPPTPTPASSHHCSAFCLYESDTLGISCKWDHTVFLYCDWFNSLSTMSSRLIHVTGCTPNVRFFLLINGGLPAYALCFFALPQMKSGLKGTYSGGRGECIYRPLAPKGVLMSPDSASWHQRTSLLLPLSRRVGW